MGFLKEKIELIIWILIYLCWGVVNLGWFVGAWGWHIYLCMQLWKMVDLASHMGWHWRLAEACDQIKHVGRSLSKQSNSHPHLKCEKSNQNLLCYENEHLLTMTFPSRFGSRSCTQEDIVTRSRLWLHF